MPRDIGGDTGGDSSRETYQSDIGKGERRPSSYEQGPIVGPREWAENRSEPIHKLRPMPELIDNAARGPVPNIESRAAAMRLISEFGNPTDTKDQPKWRETGGLKGLVGTKVPALLIPADDSRPVTTIEFDRDKIWRYDAVGYDENRVFLTEKNADLDHRSNSLATDWVQHHSDAAKDPGSHLPSPEKLYGPVYVVARDAIMEWITQSTTQLNKLKHALEWIDPFRRSD